MIKKIQRLSRQNINYLLKKGLKIQNQFFILKYSPNTISLNRYAVIITKKILAEAVKRNKLRRRIYEILRLNDQNITFSIDSILIAKREFNPTNFTHQDLKKNINSLYSSISKKNEK